MGRHWLVCPNCDQIFPQPRPDRYTGCCSRTCARELEAKQREPSKQERIDRVLSALRVELERVIK